MGDLERAPQPRGDIAGSGPGGLEGWAPGGMPAEPIDYVEAFDMEESWRLVPAETRAWAETVAGEGVPDPFSVPDASSRHRPKPRVYWHCGVSPSLSGGPRGGTMSAEYRLMVFGRRGLAVAAGTCESFDDAVANRWHSTRRAVRIDGASVRNDHRRDAPSNTDAEGDGSGAPGVASSSSILPPEAAHGFGNLPTETQQFLLAPFTTTGMPAQTGSRLAAMTQERNGRYTETYWCYLFNRWTISFAHAQRSVPYRTGLRGPALWNGSPEAIALRTAPWNVAAWTATALVPGKTVATT